MILFNCHETVILIFTTRIDLPRDECCVSWLGYLGYWTVVAKTWKILNTSLLIPKTQYRFPFLFTIIELILNVLRKLLIVTSGWHFCLIRYMKSLYEMDYCDSYLCKSSFTENGSHCPFPCILMYIFL